MNKLGYIDVKVPNNISFETFISFLEKDSTIIKIEFSTIGRYNTSNDEFLNKQWYLQVINAFNAWNVTRGSSNIKVAVLDSGTDWEHYDLGTGNDSYQNISINLNEDAWTIENNPSTGNGLDDDNNGLIDDWKGWNYAYNNNDVRTSNFHGTFVAGIVSAKTNNNFGIAGIAGGSGTSGVGILPYCIGVNAPISSVLDDAIIDAVDNGARIVQLSLTVPPSSAIEDAIQYAINNNVIVICASGNNYNSQVSFPSSNSNVIAVGAINQNLSRADFSNYGTNLDVVAPGVNIYSTTLGNVFTYS